ncbi:EAL domain-containing protein [Acuticoccus sp.]|uniref:EAL domain-containing protein n=1 Tax=Acuticoccus sp. TaxID=1904378 RepID=UPI003B51C201
MPRDHCQNCQPGTPLGFDFTFAFQPIVNVRTGAIFAHEALCRGVDGSGAGTVLANLTDANRYQFDQTARVKAIEAAARLFVDDGSRLSINIMPNAVYDPVRCLRTTLRAAKENAFPLDRLMFEFTEHEKVNDVAQLRRIATHYSSFGFMTAIDDFGAGFAGLGFLAEFVPQIIKIDRELVRAIETDRVRQAIVGGICRAAQDMDITLVAEGIETVAELEVLIGMDIDLFQGFYFARPAFERLAEVSLGAAPALLPTVRGTRGQRSAAA